VLWNSIDGVLERFQATFGIEAVVVVVYLWRRLRPTSLVTDYNCNTTRLMFIKVYGEEMVMTSSVGCDETWRKWI
jgi:hypothetical protein